MLTAAQTIIEALKYATTGEQPPNSKGGAFVHDPKLMHEREIFAQVKLSFKSIIGEDLVVTRSLRVSQKKNAKTVTLNTMECSLTVRNGSERHGISTRTAELDEMVPLKLGVAPAILENVIFCHQDESMWPMSEPSTLKKKFDEIFEAMKYTKAIDNLKQVKKKQQEDLRVHRVQQQHNKESKEKSERMQRTIEGLHARIGELGVQADEISGQMKEIDAELKVTTEQAQSFLGIVQNLDTKRQQLGYKQDNAVELRKGIDERQEPDGWLEDNLAQYEQRIQLLRDEQQQKSAQTRQLQQDLASSRNSLGAKHAEQGRLQSDKEKHERQLTARVVMVREAAERHEIRGYDGDLTDNQVRAFKDRVDKVLAEKRRDVDRVKRDNAKEIDKATGVITVLETQKAARTQDRVSAKQRMDAVDKRSAILQNEIRNLDVDEGALAVLRASAKEVDKLLQKAGDDFRNSNIDTALKKENDRLTALETEAASLTRELVECTKFAADRAQLDLRKKELEERKRKLDTLKSTWHEKLTAIVGESWQPSTLESDFQKASKKQAATAAESKKHVEATQQELKQAEYKLSSMRDRQTKLLSESARCQSAVLDVLKEVKGPEAAVEDYMEELDSIEVDVHDLEKDISLFDHLKDYYSKSQTHLNKYNKCSLCERSFADHPRERSRLMEKIVKNLDDKQKREIEADKVACEARLGQLRAVRPQHDSYRRAEAELPPLRDELKSAEAQRLTLIRQLEDQDVDFKDVDEKRQDVESMSKTVAGIAQAFRDIAEAEKQIDRLASQQDSSGPGRSVEEIEELRVASDIDLKDAKNKITKLGADRQRMRELVAARELEKSELNTKLAQAERQSERRSDLVGQLQSLKDESGQQREIIQLTDRDLESLEPEIAKARAIREDTLQRGQAKEQKAAQERDAVAHTVSELKMVESDIQDYSNRGGTANLAANQRAIVGLEQTISGMEREAAGLSEQLEKLRAEVDNGAQERKNILDNLNYRKTLRDIENLKHEIDELESRNATEDYDRLSTEARTLEDLRGKLSAERATLWGTMHSKDDEMSRLCEEYEHDYKDAPQLYMESRIKVETTTAAIDDLSRYQTALDTAVMRYHALKMEEVNRIAGELWQATYQGTDIDTILIKSDADSGAGKERRTYNYRLCMVKQDTEMDMRGRCSAGQRVLASIIIRLALAESFGVNCGLIALDEPTTNLDVDNIRSLARSLHDIIKARQAQANFQLIVITHDEEFLRHMQCSDFCDTFYRVKRDDQQNSVIEKESITKLIDG